MSEQAVIAPATGMPRRSRMKKAAIAALAAGLIMTGAFAAWVASLGSLPLAQARQVSSTVIDRNGKLLRAYAMADGRWRLPVDAKKDVDPTYVNLLLAYEDQRFRQHAGVDPLALAAPRSSSSRAAISCLGARPSPCSSRG